LKLFELKYRDISENITFRKLITEYLIKVIDEESFFYDAMKESSKKGHFIDFTVTNAKINELNNLINESINSIDGDIYKKLDLNEKQSELSNQIYEEINLLNKEKSQINNLCYFLFYKQTFAKIPEYNNIEFPGVISERTGKNHVLKLDEDEDGFYFRLYNLSKTNLKNLVIFFCKVHNEHYKRELEKQNEEKKKMSYKNRQSFSKAEKAFFIHAFKLDGWSKKDIAAELGCGLSSVERYW
jgi:hypothetical protein